MDNSGSDSQQMHNLLTAILGMHFATEDAAILDVVEAGTEYIDLASGETLFRQGDPGDDVYFVLSGRLRATMTSDSGTRRLLGEIRRGETVGELALFTGEPRSANIIAMRDSSVAKVSRAVVEQAISLAPQIALTMTRLIIQRFRRAEHDRPSPVIPVNVCILPLQAEQDAAAFARGLRAAQSDPDKIALITPADVMALFGDAPVDAVWRRDGAAACWLDAIEARHGAVYLVANAGATAWTQFCLRHADEILLLADADAAPALSPVETACLAGATPISIARQTLVLLHAPDKRTPTGTAAWLALRGSIRHFHIRPQLPADMRRIARIISGRAIGLVLAGGGAKGFAHIGVMKALEESGIEIDFVGGTSIGAIMGMVLAIGLDAAGIAVAVHKAFLRHPKGNITGDYNYIPLVSLIHGRRSANATIEAVRDAVGVDIDMEDCWLTFFVVASNYSNDTEAVLTAGRLSRNVIASYAIPGALPPVFVDSQMMYDGGTFNNFPVDVMARLGAGKIIGVDLSVDRGFTYDLDNVPGNFALLRDRLRSRANQRYQLPSVPETLLKSSFIASSPKQKTLRGIVDLLFQPSVAGIGLLDWKRYDQIVAAGYTHARDVLAALDDTGVLKDWK